MAAQNNPFGYLDLPLEVRDAILENLFSQDSTLHLPETERATIDAALRSSKTVPADLTAHEKARREKLRSVRQRYTKCVFTVAPGASSAAAVPALPEDWPHVKDIEIVIDNLALQESFDASWETDENVVKAQVAEMKTALERFVAWVCERCTAVQSVRIRFTETEDDVAVMPVVTEELPLDDEEGRFTVL